MTRMYVSECEEIVGLFRRIARQQRNYECRFEQDWISFSLNALHSAGAEHIEWMLFDHTNVPQRLQSVCDLLWRLPKDEVPFAAVITVVSTPICVRQIRRTHFGL